MNTHATPRRYQMVCVLIAAWTLTPLAVPCAAQSTNSNHAQASLRIHVHVVPVAFHHHHGRKDEARDGDDVIFSITADRVRMTVTEEERMLSAEESRALLEGKSGTAVLRTQTIVLP